MSSAEDRRRRLTSIGDVSRSLREDVDAPDLTEDILDRVSLHRTFLDARGRRMLWATRFSIALAALLLAGAVVFVHARYPEATGQPAQPTPLTTVVTTAEMEAAARLEAFRLQLETAGPVSAPALDLPLAIAGVEQPRKVMVMVGGTGASGPVALAGVSIAAAGPSPTPGPAKIALLELQAPSVPSPIEEVHRWAMTAGRPAGVPLLRANLDDTPLLLQGSLTDDVRLPR